MGDFKISIRHTEKYCYIDAINQDGVRIGKLGIDKYNVEYPRYAHLCNGNKLVKIVYVITDITHTGNGVATALLNAALEEFNGYNIYLNVVPMPRQGESIKHRFTKGLTEFYEKFGFVRCEEPGSTATMIKISDEGNVQGEN